MRIAALAVLLLLLAACGEDGPVAGDDSTPACPPAVSPDAAGAGPDRFIVGVEPGTDVAALLAAVGEQQCLELTQERELALDVLLVATLEPLGATTRQRLLAALSKAEGVRYAELDEVVTVDPLPAD